ncbi:MAG TPA: cytochrome-c oxidase, cbb3-type subunit I [Candidatus Krumholzibacteria bacterium]|nr:cytochrome-c oxidase, cbb3-type subunit I [Candidatus Krumholzibacteria bacterium]HRX51605.1 cytochrome-c oxidase, cbb3-type subunit I [Candidatus Krumholzibacteria bacterium]
MQATAPVTKKVVYNDEIVRAFSIASIVFGIVGMLVGVIVATQLSFWQANLGLQWTSFGRLRPLHTNAAIFAFVGNMIFAGVYYSLQRLLKARLASDFLGWFHFWVYQLIIVGAAVTLPLGLTQSKEYAELIWPIDLAVVVVWVAFAVNFFWTIARRNERNLYVAIWFYISTIVTIAVLYIVNNLSIPTSLTHSYPIFTGVQDALVQWWYGHNAVAFFLTTPILGIMYYYLPKAAGRPVYSYRLSIVHFWSLIFIYIWAGPHHLLYTALPDWAQTLGMIFSVMLWAPSWGGMLNGLLTLRGAWDKLRTDPVIKFFIVAVTFYGMSTFEGPLLSVKSVSALGHYTDWIIGHVHGGALGWNGFMAFGMFYWLVPRLWNTELASKRLAEVHFWVGTLGILLYVVAMWISGVSQGLYLRALDAEGFLKYPDFIEALIASRFLYQMRLVGGLAYFLSSVLGAGVLFATMAKGKKATVSVDVTVLKPTGLTFRQIMTGAPVLYSTALVVLTCILLATGTLGSAFAVAGFAVVTIAAALSIGVEKTRKSWHDMVEAHPLSFTVLALLAILIGGLVEIIPLTMDRTKEQDLAAQADSLWTEGGQYAFIQMPYSPLELAGRDIYVREGCYVCHSQMVRPFRHETLRYGEYSRAAEFIYDTPFQWGSKRTGPDLHRVGGRYANLWHYLHMRDPRSTSPGSNMPTYMHLETATADLAALPGKMGVLVKIGVPYDEADIAGAEETALSQGRLIADDLAQQDVELAPDSELAALIAYLQRLGRGPQPTGMEPAADAVAAVEVQ